MKVRNFVILLVAIFAVSCISDKEGGVSVKFKNESSYEISLLRVYQDVNGSNVIEDYRTKIINKGEEYLLGVHTHQGFALPINALWYEVNYVGFANEVMVSLPVLFKDESMLELIESSKCYNSYSYTFTDADYQYALENGEKLNQ